MTASWRREDSAWIYDVFLSFSGMDTRNNFTGHLLAALERGSFYTFRDDTKLRRGEEIGTGLLKAIEVSRISIVVFSKNYASSRWCLEELVKIMDCRSTLNQIVIPVFYDVKPSDVRSQMGYYAEAFANHEERFQLDDSVERWRAALREAADVSGFVLEDDDSDRYEPQFIDYIVREVANKLNPTCLSVADYPVGIEHHVEQLSLFLNLGSIDDVKIVAIWGIGGVGKTTIAKAMYNLIYHRFETRSFLADVGRTSLQPNGLVELQEKLLCDLLMDGNQRIRSKDHGIEVIKLRAWRRRVLLVLDDVDNICQLRAFVINRDLFCSGSRIIITTRDLSPLSLLRVDKVYEPQGLNENESLELFSWHAFGEVHPTKNYEDLSKKVVDYAQKLPLVLEILGSFLSEKPIEEWISQLEKLKKIPNDNVQGKLRLSFDSLDGEQKGLFLHIACFFVGMDLDLAMKILKGCGFFPESEIGVLSRRCLLRIDARNRIMMHDRIQDMAREIVRQESPQEPGERSRLWHHEDVLDVLKNNTGTEAIQGLVLNLPKSEKLPVNAFAFTKMKRLNLLHLNYVLLSGSYRNLSRRLAWLSWKGFPLKCIPATLIMDKMVAIDLSYSRLRELWIGTKVLTKLKYLNLGHSYFLIQSPDFAGLPGLEILLLNDCTELVKVHQSIGSLKNLAVLDLKNCHSLQKLPLSIFMLNSLLYFNLSRSSKLEWPAVFQGLPPDQSKFSSLQFSSSITKLYMENCNITYVPSEFGSLSSLRFLNLSKNNFSTLPDTITTLPELLVIYVNHCSRLESIPALPISLLGLSANYCTSLESISIESNGAGEPFMTFYGCTKLVNNKFSYNFRRNLLQYQGLREQGRLNIFLPGSEVPKWCNYQNEGRRLSFEVPQFVDANRIIEGFILCVVFTGFRNEDDDKFAISYNISNISKRAWRFNRQARVDFYPIRCEDQMWLAYVPNRYLESELQDENCWLEGEDKVEISIQIDKHWLVTKCGVSLVYGGDDEKDDPVLYNGGGMIQYMGGPKKRKRKYMGVPEDEENSISVASGLPAPPPDESQLTPLITNLQFLREIGKISEVEEPIRQDQLDCCSYRFLYLD